MHLATVFLAICVGATLADQPSDLELSDPDGETKSPGSLESPGGGFESIADIVTRMSVWDGLAGLKEKTHEALEMTRKAKASAEEKLETVRNLLSSFKSRVSSVSDAASQKASAVVIYAKDSYRVASDKLKWLIGSV